MAQWFVREWGCDWERLRREPTDTLREKMLRVKGIGPETADSILLYALGHETFVVDAYTKRISSSGVMGDPTKASAEKGAQMWEVMVAHLVTLVEDLKGLTLDEIFQRRY